MSYSKLKIISQISAVFILSFYESSSAQTNTWNKCTRQYGDLSCEAYVKAEFAHGVLKPKDFAEAVASEVQGERVILRSPFEDPKNPGWLLTQVMPNDIIRPAWLRASEVARNWEFGKVIDCWPIELIEWAVRGEGDSPNGTYRAKMDINGNVSIEDKEITANDSNYRPIEGRYSIYLADNLFRFADISKPQPDSWLIGNFVLDIKKLSVKVRGLGKGSGPVTARALPIRLMKERECKSGPIVDAQKPLSPKPRRK